MLPAYVLIFYIFEYVFALLFVEVLYCSTRNIFTYRLCIKKSFDSDLVEILILIPIMSFILQNFEREMQQ